MSRTLCYVRARAHWSPTTTTKRRRIVSYSFNLEASGRYMLQNVAARVSIKRIKVKIHYIDRVCSGPC